LKSAIGDPGAVRLREPEEEEWASKAVELPAASTKRHRGESKINRVDQASVNQAARKAALTAA
jgi:hypothetical protein